MPGVRATSAYLSRGIAAPRACRRHFLRSKLAHSRSFNPATALKVFFCVDELGHPYAAAFSPAVAVSSTLSPVPRESFRATSTSVGTIAARNSQEHRALAEILCAAEAWVYQMA